MWKAISVAAILAAVLFVPDIGPGQKATGGVRYEAEEGLSAHIAFVAREAAGERPAGGHLLYGDTEHRWYILDVSEVNVEGSMAFFAGEIASASESEWIGQWVYFAVHDGGTPGRKGDEVWSAFVSQEAASDTVQDGDTPGSAHQVTRGNLVVHGTEPEEDDVVPLLPIFPRDNKPACVPGGPPGLCR